MKSVQLVFGVHNHQSEGDFKEAYEADYQRAYKPFLSVLNSYPEFPVVLYYCGPLLEWMEEAHPEFLMLLEEMVRRKQVELLSGGFYEPVLTMIPTSDKLGQLEKMTTYLRSRFGVRPRGCWLPHQVWEPTLVLSLRDSGMDFTFLEDRFFRISGLEQGDLYHPYLTEDQGKTITVFPLSRELQELAHRGDPRRVIRHLKGLAGESDGRVVVLLLEGEKLGREERIRQRLLEQRGLARLLEAIWKNRDWLEPLTPNRYLRQHPPRGRTYFPCLSCQEMVRGSFSAGQKERFLQLLDRVDDRAAEANLLAGGLFRRYLTRYPEVNLLYSRMIYTHLLVNQIRGDKYKKLAARNELWRGQSGTVYWNSPSGGVYAGHLRKAAFRSFLEAEQIARVSEMFIPSIIGVDFDMDGESEYLFQGETINAYVHKRGGVLFEMDYLPIRWNYQDTVARWAETYHERPQDGCDRYWRKAFIDHFFPPAMDLGRFQRMDYREAGDFVDQPYEVVQLDRDRMELALRRTGSVVANGEPHPLSLEKRFLFRKSEVELQVRLTNPAGRPLSLWYGTEINLALGSPERADTRVFGTHGKGKKKELGTGPLQSAALDSLEIQDIRNGAVLLLSSPQSFALWAHPIETVSACGGTTKRTYQCSCYLPHWKLQLKPEESWQTSLFLSLKTMEA
jgi:alpha-amylase